MTRVRVKCLTRKEKKERKKDHIQELYKKWVEKVANTHFENPSRSCRTSDQDHFKNLQKIHWKQNIEKWGVAKDFCTVLVVPAEKRMIKLEYFYSDDSFRIAAPGFWLTLFFYAA